MIARSLLPMATALMVSGAAMATPLAPHQAVYELTLASESQDFVDAQGRIAMELRTDKCGLYDLDYRFVARFQQEQEFTLTDQQTNSVENQEGTSFAFTTKTFVDGSPEKEISGEAKQDAAGTKVTMKAPVAKDFLLPVSRFPMQHTIDLITKAKAGERFVETKLFDGDDDAEKLLSSTAIISPATAAPPRPPMPASDASEAVKAAVDPAVEKRLAGLQSWRISESYYNSDSDPDGMPVFETSYRLYENGVSDDLELDFGSYALKGSLSHLDLFEVGACR